MGDIIFGERLRMLRKRAGLTQQQVAARLSIHRTAYTKYETSGVTPDPQGLVRLAEAFGVTVDFLVGREEVPPCLSDTDEPQVEVSLQEKQLLQVFRQLTDEEKHVLLQQAQAALHQRRSRK